MKRIECRELYPISYYEYGEPYFGSCGGMRYRIAREPLANVHYTPPEKRDPAVLAASAWPEPLSYAAADRETMVTETFPFTQEGLQEACDWLNSRIG